MNGFSEKNGFKLLFYKIYVIIFPTKLIYENSILFLLLNQDLKTKHFWNLWLNCFNTYWFPRKNIKGTFIDPVETCHCWPGVANLKQQKGDQARDPGNFAQSENLSKRSILWP